MDTWSHACCFGTGRKNEGLTQIRQPFTCERRLGLCIRKIGLAFEMAQGAGETGLLLGNPIGLAWPLNIDHDETRIKTSNQQNWLDSNGNSKANEEQSKGSQNARSTSTRHSSTADQAATICRSNRQRISQRDLLEYRIMANEVNTRSTTKQIRFHLIRQIAFRQRKETRID